MNILIVFCHPKPATQSFSGAIVDYFITGAENAGHTCEVADLYREAFNPVITENDLQQFDGFPVPDDVSAERARIERSDGLCFVFPLWWYGMPAMLKGWLDRVWSVDWANELTLRSSSTLISLGSNHHRLEKWDDDKQLDIIWRNGVLELCGVIPSDTHFLVDSGLFNEDPVIGHLDRARQLGSSFGENAPIGEQSIARVGDSMLRSV